MTIFSEKKIFKARALVLAVALIFNLLYCSQKQVIEKETIDNCIKLYQSNVWTLRRDGIIKASNINSPPAIDLLIKATYDDHSLVRIEALNGLANSIPHQALNRLKEMAELEKDTDLKWYALKTLSKYNDPQAALIFVKNLKDSDWLIREESIKGLLLIDDFTTKYVSIPNILDLFNDQNEEVIITMLTYLDIKDNRIYDRLKTLLQNTSKSKHSMLIAILKSLQGYKIDKNTQSILINLLVNQNEEVRIMALRVLKQKK